MIGANQNVSFIHVTFRTNQAESKENEHKKNERKSFIQLFCAMLDKILITVDAFPNGNLERRQEENFDPVSVSSPDRGKCFNFLPFSISTESLLPNIVCMLTFSTGSHGDHHQTIDSLKYLPNLSDTSMMIFHA